MHATADHCCDCAGGVRGTENACDVRDPAHAAPRVKCLLRICVRGLEDGVVPLSVHGSLPRLVSGPLTLVENPRGVLHGCAPYKSVESENSSVFGERNAVSRRLQKVVRLCNQENLILHTVYKHTLGDVISMHKTSKMPTSGGADGWPAWYKETLVDPSERMRLQIRQQDSAAAAAMTRE